MSETIDFGIDLGTTNSSIAYCRGGEVRLFQNGEVTNVTPSVVYVGATGRMLVGKKAYDTWVSDPENTQAEFKRWIGFSDKMKFPAAGKEMSAEELSAEVLKALRADVQRVTGEVVGSSVITVPAAFGSLQCDATGKAARLAGLAESPLLQEPIAAAIAYGATPAAAGQRWMVFDLGGGTLDIAIVSTRNGRLAVLDHQGDNRLGGKDLDRLIAETFFCRALADGFALPQKKEDGGRYEGFMRALVRHAEVAKIALSTTKEVTVELFDLGRDRDGKAIEGTVVLKREEVDAAVTPLVDRCVKLAERALVGARVSGKDLDRILLVGGPTQMPMVREALTAHIGATLDCSLDPMTVVARGAALYGSTLEKSVKASKAQAVVAGVTAIQLSFERASGTLESPVAGVLPVDSIVHEIKIESQGRLWTSGWMPVEGGVFQTEVMLSDKRPVTQFAVSARDRMGHAVKVAPETFSIAFMLPMAAPPLPHTIAIEIMGRSGDSAFDPIFKRGCPLPAEARRTYRADQTIRPSDMTAALPIKFWEIDVSDDPQEKWWAGCVNIRADQIKRPITEGSEIELTVKIDQSRKITIETFVPLLNQSFQEGVYIPDPPSARSQFQQQLDLCFARLSAVHGGSYDLDRDDLRERAENLQMTLEHLAEQATEHEKHGGDPDEKSQSGLVLRKVRMQLAQLEEQLEAGGPSTLGREVRGEARWTEHVVMQCGTESDKTEIQRVRTQLEKYVEEDDQRGIKWARDQLREVRGVILDNQPWFWMNVLDFLKRPGRQFLNGVEAKRWLGRAEQAAKGQNLPELRAALCRVWEMQPPDQVELSKQQAAQSGLRG
jgi:molecular chaperone DnaK